MKFYLELKNNRKNLKLNRNNKINNILLFNEQFKYLKTTHSYHLVDPSPWLAVASLGAFMITSGLVLYMHKFIGGWALFQSGFLLTFYVMYTWWRDVIREATFEDQHSIVVQKGLRLGMILFIVSEVMFFFAFFHSSLAPVENIYALAGQCRISTTIIKEWFVKSKDHMYRGAIWSLTAMYGREKYSNDEKRIKNKAEERYNTIVEQLDSNSPEGISLETITQIKKIANKEAFDEEAGFIHKTNRWLQNKVTTNGTNQNEDRIRNIEANLNNQEHQTLQAIRVLLRKFLENKKQMKKNIYNLYALIISVCLLIFYLYIDEIILFNYNTVVMIFKNPASFLLIYEISNIIFIMVSIILFIFAYHDSIKLRYILKKSGNLPIKYKLRLLYFTVLFSIPNKVFVYNKFPNSLTYLTLYILFFLLYLSPILLFPIFLYYFCIFENLTFSYIFDKNIKIQTLISKHMFNNDVTLTNIYLKEFWGKSYKGTAYDRFKKGLSTLPLPILTNLLIELNIMKSRHEIDECTKEIENKKIKERSNIMESEQNISESLDKKKIGIEELHNIHVESRKLAFDEKASTVHKTLEKVDVYRENLIKKHDDND